MECDSIGLSRHALARMFERGIPPKAVFDIVRKGEIIASYPDDRPYPSCLLLGYWQAEPCSCCGCAPRRNRHLLGDHRLSS